MTRPFRFAVQATKATTATEWRDTARRVEGLGFSTLFLSDHYLGPGPAQEEARWPPQYLAPIAAMSVAAAVTSTLRVGCRVFCTDYHVPGVLVKEAATLDMLSDGRSNSVSAAAGASPNTSPWVCPSHPLRSACRNSKKSSHCSRRSARVRHWMSADRTSPRKTMPDCRCRCRGRTSDHHRR